MAEQRVVVRLNKRPDQRLGLGCAATAAGDVRISSLAGAAAECKQLQVGDVVELINKKPIKALSDVSEAMKAYNNTGELVLSVRRGGAAAASTSGGQVVKHTCDVMLEYEEGEPLGVYIDKNYIVTKLQPGSISDGKFQIGDKVVAVHGWPLRGEKEFYDKLLRSAPSCVVKVERTGVPGAAAKPTSTVEAPPFEDHNMKTVTLEIGQGDAVGIVPDEALEVIHIQAGTKGAAVFKMGDIIKEVNGTKVTDVNHLYDIFEKLSGKIEVKIDRSKYRESEVEHEMLPDNIEKMIQRHHGFKYSIVQVKYDDKRPFGLNIANCAHNRVVVTSVKEGSVAADVFKVFDRVLAINASPVTDEKVAKEYICAAGGNFHAVIERPANPERWNEIRVQYEQWKTRATARPKAEDELPVDAMMIAQAYKQKRKEGKLAQAKKVLKQPEALPHAGKSLTFNQQVNRLEIVSDVPPGKQLRKCS